MRLTVAFAAACSFAAGSQRDAPAPAAQVNSSDLAAIKQLESEWQKAWNRHDMQALAALVSEDVDFVTVSGTWLTGRREFEAHHAARHLMQFRESVWTTTAVRVKALKPNVAVVHVDWSLKGDKDPDGTAREPRSGIFTRIVMKESAGWIITASQNTNIPATLATAK